MPELPEVESVRRGLARAGLEAAVAKVERSSFALRTGAHWAKRLERVRRLQGCRPASVDRRGKYLLWEFLRPGEGSWTLLVHLGMSGRCTVHPAETPKAAHTHLRLRFEDGRVFDFVDPRRFGGLRCDTRSALETSAPLAELGPEPWSPEFSAEALHARLHRSRRALRDALLDQRVVAGIGNIYASEICARAGIDPRVACSRLRPSAWARVHGETRRCLRDAISRGGTTLRDYRNIEGGRGRNQRALWVYGRSGQPCARCESPVSSEILQGRALFWCPSCQARPRGRWVV